MRQEIGQTGLMGSCIALGCMRMAELEDAKAEAIIARSVDTGINFFDHADIYGGGQSEVVFAKALSQLAIKREDLILQSKCGIRQGYFDFSKEHILASVDGILKRLRTDYLDILALHRPDALWEPEEVAEAFSQLKKAGKVKHFGVSNQNQTQLAFLSHYLEEPLQVNQLQLSPVHTPMIDAGLNVNMANLAAADRDGGVIDYCRWHQITIQAWSPFQIDLAQGLFFNHPDYKALNDTLEKYAKHYQVSVEAIVIAWILRHPARMQAIVGTMNPDRLTKIAEAENITLTRAEWYDIYTSARHILP